MIYLLLTINESVHSVAAFKSSVYTDVIYLLICIIHSILYLIVFYAYSVFIAPYLCLEWRGGAIDGRPPDLRLTGRGFKSWLSTIA